MAELIVFLISAAVAYFVGSKTEIVNIPSPRQVMDDVARTTPPTAITADPQPERSDGETFLEGTPEEIMTQLGMSKREFAEYLRSGRFGGGGE